MSKCQAPSPIRLYIKMLKTTMIYTHVINKGTPAINNYLNFLKSGSSDYPIEVLIKAGVDMNSSEPILAVTRKMNDLLDQLEDLIEY